MANLLVESGHTVTYMSTNIPKSLHPNIQKRDLPVCTEAMNNLTRRGDSESTTWRGILHKLDSFFKACDRWYEEDNVRLLLQTEEKFDLFVTSGLFETCALGLAHHLGIKSTIVQMPGPILTPYLIHEMGLPLYSSSVFIDAFTPRESTAVKTSITARAHNLAKRFLLDTLYYSFMGWYSEPAVYKHIPSYPGYRETYKSVKLMLMHFHSHPLIDGPIPMGPGVVPIGGAVCRPYKTTNMSPDLIEFVDSATGGVIYISFGSLESDGAPEEQSKLLEVFRNLPYKVVWKQGNVVENLPNNVKVVSWLDQMSLLQHPNMKLFITHGGYASKIEALCAGLPLLVVPRMALDQFHTAQRIADTGLGAQIPDLDNTPASEILAKILDITGNAAYSERVKQVSKELHQTKITDGQVLGYLEAAIAGNAFLPGYQPWYQYFYLDIIAVPLVTVYCVKLLFTKCFKR